MGAVPRAAVRQVRTIWSISASRFNPLVRLGCGGLTISTLLKPNLHALNREKDSYEIQWLNSPKTKWVKRLNLFFEDESRLGFRFRLRQARRRKEQIEREARYHDYVHKQPFRNIDVLDDRFRRRVTQRCGNDAAARMPSVASEFMEDARADFKFAVKAAIVDYLFGDYDGAAHLAAANVQPIRVSQRVPEIGFVNLAALPQGCMLVSQDGQLEEAHDVLTEPFSLRLADIQRGGMSGSGALLQALQQFYIELDVRSLKIADVAMTGLSLPAKLQDFVKVQRMHRDEIADQLSTDWTMKVIAIVEKLIPSGPPAQQQGRSAFETGNGGLDSPLVPSSPPGSPPGKAPAAQEPEVNKAQVMRFVKMLSLIMTDQLRTAVFGSIEQYRSFWRQYDFQLWEESMRAGYPDDHTPQDFDPEACPSKSHAEVVDANTLYRSTHATGKWGEDLFTADPPPLFSVQLLVRESEIRLVPSAEEVEAAVVRSFDEMITAAQSVDDISVKMVNVAAEQVASGDGKHRCLILHLHPSLILAPSLPSRCCRSLI